MKSLKAAAVVAGSLVIAGAAAPAFAVDTPVSGLNGAVKTLTRGTGGLDVAKNTKPVTNTLQDPASALTGQKSLLGGLPLGK
ncbi:hypothetical protein M2271_001281 [Streptomyces sp. LBL]|uniref:hypothetical protein n=1 Tax=Streptomyces sp. LBL TaxID=2940562 RepID=UPI0024748588|nr:hypothetical protein [Streptomyces sp. LBL]MDH6623494.1 hypothetical protein [Streptomyces sp. LBL]